MIRRLSVALLVAAASATAVPASASAGTYYVGACFQKGSPVNNSWRAYAYNGYAHAYALCPTEGDNDGLKGLVARNTSTGGVAPNYSHASIYFDAPPGARVTAMSGEINQLSTTGWFAGVYDESAAHWLWCGAAVPNQPCLSTFGWRPFNLMGLSTGRISALVMCVDASCDDKGLHAVTAMRNVTVAVTDAGRPHVAITGGSALGGWRKGVQDVRVDSSDPVGIHDALVAIDGNKQAQATHPCDPTYAAPCTNGGDVLRIDTRSLSDGRHTLSARATDSAGNTSKVYRNVWLDNTSPAAPAGLTSDAGAGWRAQGRFTLRWANPRQTAAPIAGAKIAVCPIAESDPTQCPAVFRKGKDLATATEIGVPRSGQWRAFVWLTDAAGNANIAYSSQTILRFDSQVPTLAIRPPDPDHPTVVQVNAADQGSGIATREIFLRRRGQATWISLPVTATRAGFSAVVDDESLPDGRYQLRARVVDRAGNERSTERRTDGKPAELALPLRIKTRLAVGRPKRVRALGARGKRRYRIKLIESPNARYGKTIPLRGRLTSPGGNPLAGRGITVMEQTHLPASPWRPIATLRTNRAGHFKFKALRGPSRTLRFRFGGSDTIRGRTADVRLGVRASSTIRASRKRVVNGESVTFGGRMRGRPLPVSGKLVVLQVYARGRWLTFGTARASSTTGRWSHRYRFTATRGNVRYRFRVRIPKEAGHPYESGASRTVVVRVRGL